MSHQSERIPLAKKIIDYTIYLFVRLISLTTTFMPMRLIDRCGKIVGSLLFQLVPSYRKRLITNLQLATTLQSKNKKALAKKSLQTLCTTFLEFCKFSHMKNFDKIFHNENPEVLSSLQQKHKSIIIAGSHLSNWEALILNISYLNKTLAIGRPFKNVYIYKWITKNRERFHGKIITSKNTISQSKKALKDGKIVGILFDQTMLKGGIETQFFGRTVWTNPLPAHLAYRTKNPIIFYSCTKQKGKFHFKYSSPLEINFDNPYKEEVQKITQSLLNLLEKEVQGYPEQYLWLHNRFKKKPSHHAN